MDKIEKTVELQKIFYNLREDNIKARHAEACEKLVDFKEARGKDVDEWDFMSYRAGYISALSDILYEEEA